MVEDGDEDPSRVRPESSSTRHVSHPPLSSVDATFASCPAPPFGANDEVHDGRRNTAPVALIPTGPSTDVIVQDPVELIPPGSVICDGDETLSLE